MSLMVSHSSHLSPKITPYTWFINASKANLQTSILEAGNMHICVSKQNVFTFSLKYKISASKFKLIKGALSNDTHTLIMILQCNHFDTLALIVSFSGKAKALKSTNKMWRLLTSMTLEWILPFPTFHKWHIAQ